MEYGSWLDEWLTEYVKTSTKNSTYEKYKQQSRQYIIPLLGNYELSELSAKRLQGFAAKLFNNDLALSTVNGVLSVLKSSLRRAVNVGLTDRQYTDCIQRPKLREKMVECFSREEQRKIENFVLNKNKPKLFGIVFCLYTGVRIGELLALSWTDLDLVKGVVSVSKTCRDSWECGRYVKVTDTPKTACSSRLIPLPRQLLSRVRAMKKSSSGKFFVEGRNEYGAQVRSYQKTFESLLVRLGIAHKGFHSLRHTFATRALECGMDVKALSEILGHINPTITLKRYVHSLLEHKAAMMNRLGQLLV